MSDENGDAGLAAMTGKIVPKVSLVLPTTGNEASVRRALGCVTGFGSERLLRGIELIVFLNVKDDPAKDYSGIERYVESLRPLVHSAKVVRTGRYYISAEESALNGVKHATGELLWIVGDKRIFTPEGLTAIDAFVHERPAPCAYFNSVWFTNLGFSNAHASTHMASPRALLPYKQWVMRHGFNFMATSMGAWIYERQLMDLGVWKEIIDTCGAHFSHVTAMLYGIREKNVMAHSVFAIQAEAKAYHDGDTSEWNRYADLAGTYLYYPWTFGIVRQFQFLIDRGVYRYDDLRRSMCSEAMTLRRQVDEIYNHFFVQIRLGRSNLRERLSAEQCEEIVGFLDRVCPEKVILNRLLRDFHAGAETDDFKIFDDKSAHIGDACSLDWKQVKLSSLIVGQVGSSFVRLHPSGYLLSKVTDNEHFLLAYKLLDPPATSIHWTLTDGDILSVSNNTVAQPRAWSDLYPPSVERRTGTPDSARRRRVRQVVSALYRHEWVARRVSAMPRSLKVRLRAWFM
jgi:hypothetical protein